MDSFDRTLLLFLNQFAQHSWRFDLTVVEVAHNVLVRSGVMLAALWYVWFRSPQEASGNNQADRSRAVVLSGIVLSCIALAVARGLALCLPFRERPLRIPALHFRPPVGIDNVALIHWSSFPSDHAALYFALATTLFLVSRKIGLLAYVYAFVLVCLPRVYLGLHYPTDIIAGAAIGTAVASLAGVARVRDLVARPALGWLDTSPGTFYPGLYLATLMLATNFDPLRTTAVFGWELLKASAATSASHPDVHRLPPAAPVSAASAQAGAPPRARTVRYTGERR